VAGECCGYRSEQASIILGEVGTVVLSVLDAKLVASDVDLDVFGAAGTDSETGKRPEETAQNSIHTLRLGGNCPVQQPRPSFGHP